MTHHISRLEDILPPFISPIIDFDTFETAEPKKDEKVVKKKKKNKKKKKKQFTIVTINGSDYYLDSNSDDIYDIEKREVVGKNEGSHLWVLVPRKPKIPKI